MALTFTTEPTVDTWVAGNKKMVVATVLFDNSYPTGGEAITPDNFGLHRLDVVIPQQHASRVVVWDDTNSKILLYTALGTQAGSASDQSTITIQVLAIGV